MTDYKTMYLTLFHAISDALKDMEQANYGLASQRLIAAQQEAEEQYIGQE